MIDGLGEFITEIIMSASNIMGERGAVDRNTCHVQTRVGAIIREQVGHKIANETRIRSNRVNREPRSVSYIRQRRTESKTKEAGKRSCNARSKVAIDRIAGCGKAHFALSPCF